MQGIEEAFEKLQKEVATIKDDMVVTKAVDREEMHVLVKKETCMLVRKENEELRMQLNGVKEDNRGLNNTVMKLQEEVATIKADLAVVEAVVNMHANPRSEGGCLESTPRAVIAPWSTEATMKERTERREEEDALDEISNRHGAEACG